MKYSPYILWAKKHHNITYNLAGSGMPAPLLNKLVDAPAEILKPVEHENGWGPLMAKIGHRYEVEPSRVVPVHSASLANHLVCSLLLDPGDEVLIEDPAYGPLVSLPKYLNARVKRFKRSPERAFQPDPEEIEQQLTKQTKLIILSNLHNPSGALLEEVVFWQLADLAEKYGCYLLIDEVYLEFLYPQGERTGAKFSDRILTTRSLTKAFGLDDLRVGWIIAEPVLAEKIRKLQDLFITTMASPSERLGLLMLEQADAILTRNIDLLQQNVRLVDDFVKNQQKLSWQKPPAGSVGFVHFSGGNVDMLAGYLAEQHDTVVAPGSFFGAPEYFRIGWGMPADHLEEALKRLGKVVG